MGRNGGREGDRGGRFHDRHLSFAPAYRWAGVPAAGLPRRRRLRWRQRLVVQRQRLVVQQQQQLCGRDAPHRRRRHPPTALALRSGSGVWVAAPTSSFSSPPPRPSFSFSAGAEPRGLVSPLALSPRRMPRHHRHHWPETCVTRLGGGGGDPRKPRRRTHLRRVASRHPVLRGFLRMKYKKNRRR